MTDNTQISGVVERIHGNGLKLQGSEGWINQSKFTKDKTMPAEGQRVTLELDKAGFIRSWTAEGPAPSSSPARSGYGVANTKDELIVRQVALKAAVEYVAATKFEEASIPEVTDLAQQFYNWVMGVSQEEEEE